MPINKNRKSETQRWQSCSVNIRQTDAQLTFFTGLPTCFWRGGKEEGARTHARTHAHTHTHTHTHTRARAIARQTGNNSGSKCQNPRQLDVKQDRVCPTPISAFLQYRGQDGYILDQGQPVECASASVTHTHTHTHTAREETKRKAGAEH